MKNSLKLRIISAAGYLVVLAFALFIHPYVFAAIFSAIMIICLYEYYEITKKIGANPQKIFIIVYSEILFILTYLYVNKIISASMLFMIALSLAFLILAAELLRSGNSFKNLSAEFFGILYISVPFSLTNYIVFYNGKFDYSILLGVLTIIWVYDIFAYFIGSSIGKRKIAPDISPNKTLEGTIGGITLSILASLGVFFVLKTLKLIDWVFISLLVSGGAFIGDLIESKLKRSAGVKDSGKIMPGHGGLLDRFDSFLFASVGAALYLMFIKIFQV